MVLHVNCRRCEGHPDPPLLQNFAKSGGIGTAFTKQCKFCGDLITLILLISGRWQAQNLDNTLHRCAMDAHIRNTSSAGAI